MMSEKRMAILRSVIDTAAALSKIVPAAYPKKQMFAKNKYLRAPIKRKTKTIARMMLATTSAIGAAQIHLIMSQPIPKRNFESGGDAFVVERGSELIERDGKFELVQPKITYLPQDTKIIPL